MTLPVKVCGITRLDDARLAAALGATRIGFVFWRKSPRYVTPEAARGLVAALPAGVTAVGVFVNETPETVQRIVRFAGLDAAQLHGDESAEDFAGVAGELIKAVPVGPGFEAAHLSGIPPRVGVLLDAHDPVRRGGTGRTVDWSAAAAAARVRPVILSGGLNAHNVAGAIAAVRPWMIDVSSGVESAPGIKDPDKLRAFFAAVP